MPSWPPVDEDEDDEEQEVVVMRIGSDDNGEDLLEAIEDEEEMQAAFDAFLAMVEEEEGECPPGASSASDPMRGCPRAGPVLRAWRPRGRPLTSPRGRPRAQLDAAGQWGYTALYGSPGSPIPAVRRCIPVRQAQRHPLSPPGRHHPGQRLHPALSADGSGQAPGAAARPGPDGRYLAGGHGPPQGPLPGHRPGPAGFTATSPRSATPWRTRWPSWWRFGRAGAQKVYLGGQGSGSMIAPARHGAPPRAGDRRVLSGAAA